MKSLVSLRKPVLALGLLAAPFSVFAQSDVDLENEDNRIGYAIGVNIGQNLIQQNIIGSVPFEAFIAGLTDTVNDSVAR